MPGALADLFDLYSRLLWQDWLGEEGASSNTGEWGPSWEAWPLGDFILFFFFFVR